MKHNNRQSHTYTLLKDVVISTLKAFAELKKIAITYSFSHFATNFDFVYLCSKKYQFCFRLQLLERILKDDEDKSFTSRFKSSC